jgi:hypothetical protein
MKRRIGITLGLGVSIVALTVPSAQAAPPVPTENNPKYPASKGYYFVDDTVNAPKGFVCSGAVTIRFVGHQRDYYNGKLADPNSEPPEPKLGDRHTGQSPDEIIVVTNVKTGRNVTKLISGTFYDRVVDYGKKGVLDLSAKGVGKNVFFGPGVKGIVYADGVQHFTVTNFLNDGGTLHLNKTKGKTVELCHKVGLRAVPGKVLPEPPTT